MIPLDLGIRTSVAVPAPTRLWGSPTAYSRLGLSVVPALFPRPGGPMAKQNPDKMGKPKTAAEIPADKNSDRAGQADSSPTLS
jgi:hypothetical protein